MWGWLTPRHGDARRLPHRPMDGMESSKLDYNGPAGAFDGS